MPAAAKKVGSNVHSAGLERVTGRGILGWLRRLRELVQAKKICGLTSAAGRREVGVFHAYTVSPISSLS
jgi:hypothetical protein